MQLAQPTPYRPATRPQATGTAVQPKFQGIPKTAFSQFMLDVLGVWVPKMPLTRSKTQFVEDAFLENAENVAFYFAVPIVAPLIAKLVQKLPALRGPVAQGKVSTNLVGSSWKELEMSAVKKAGSTAKLAGKQLIGAKMGTLIGVVGFAAACEYMVQHVKNVMTARQFHTKNFAAVAGLESAQANAQKGELDPVAKAKRRAWQVGGALLGSFALASAAPALVKNSKLAEKVSRNVLNYMHFGSDKAQGVFFDLTKPLLALFAGIGAVSYIDAARDSLERKETGLRLAVVIPYMLVGKELAGNALARLINKLPLNMAKAGEKANYQSLGNALKQYSVDGKALSLLKTGNLLEQFFSPETFMNLNAVKSNLEEGVKQAVRTGSQEAIPQHLQKAILNRYKLIKWGSYGLSAAVCGLGINWLAYRQTKARYERQQASQQAAAAQETSSGLPAIKPFKRRPLHEANAFGQSHFASASPFPVLNARPFPISQALVPPGAVAPRGVPKHSAPGPWVVQQGIPQQAQPS